MKIFFINFLIFIVLSFVFAQEEGFNLIQAKILRILGNIIRFLFSALMIIASIYLVIYGIKYMIVKGKVEELHKALLYLIIGIVLLITSLFIPNLIKNFIESLIQ